MTYVGARLDRRDRWNTEVHIGTADLTLRPWPLACGGRTWELSARKISALLKEMIHEETDIPEDKRPGVGRDHAGRPRPADSLLGRSGLPGLSGPRVAHLRGDHAARDSQALGRDACLGAHAAPAGHRLPQEPGPGLDGQRGNHARVSRRQVRG